MTYTTPSELLRIQDESSEAKLRVHQARAAAAMAHQTQQEAESRVELLMQALEAAMSDETSVCEKLERARRHSTQIAKELEKQQDLIGEKKEAAALALVELKGSEQRYDEGKRASAAIDNLVLQKERELEACRFRQKEVHHQHTLGAMHYAYCKESVEASALQLAEAQQALDATGRALDEGLAREKDTAKLHSVMRDELRRCKESLEASKRDSDSAALKGRQLDALATEADKVASHVAAALNAVTDGGAEEGAGAAVTPEGQASGPPGALLIPFLQRSDNAQQQQQQQKVGQRPAPPNTPEHREASPVCERLSSLTSPVRLSKPTALRHQ